MDEVRSNSIGRTLADEALKQAFHDHQDETDRQVERLEQGFELLGRAERSEKCDAAAGLVEEGKSVINEIGEDGPKDVMLTAAGRKAEHYGIASYEDAARFAKVLRNKELAELLESTLTEERATAKKLKSIGRRLAKRLRE